MIKFFKPMPLVLIICLFLPGPAHAYLDPGTGSYVLQVVIASLLGAAFFLKTQWHRLKGFFARFRGGKENHDAG